MYRKKSAFEQPRKNRAKGAALALLFTVSLLGCANSEVSEPQSSQVDPQTEQVPQQSSVDTTIETQVSRVDPQVEQTPQGSEDSPVEKYVLSTERNNAVADFAKAAAADIVSFSEQPRTKPDVGGFTFDEIKAGGNIGDPAEEGYFFVEHDATLSGPATYMTMVIKKVDGKLDPASIVYLYVDAPHKPAVTISAPNYGPSGFVVYDPGNPRGYTVAVGASEQDGSDSVVGSGEKMGPTGPLSITVPGSGSKLGQAGELGDTDRLAEDTLDASLKTTLDAYGNPIRPN